MKFLSIPDDFAPVSEAVIYTILPEDDDPVTEVTVKELSDNRTVARLRFAQREIITLDIAPFLRRIFDVQPALCAGSQPLYDTSRTKIIVVEANGTASDARIFSLFASDGLPRLITTAPAERTLGTGEFDDAAFFAPDGGNIFLVSDSGNRTIPLERRYEAGIVRILESDIHPDDDSATLIFSSAGRTQELLYRRTLRPRDSVRVAWLSASGAVEYYTFMRQKHTITVDKNRFYGSQGYQTVSADKESLLDIVSDYEPRHAIESLEEIVSSPRVWIVNGGLFTEADVLSSQTVHRFDNGSLNSVSLRIRTRKRGEESL